MSEVDILVSGASGRTGGAAAEELLAMGKRVRAYVRSNDDRAAALRHRGVDVAIGDFTDIDDIRAAKEGVHSAYFLHPIKGSACAVWLPSEGQSYVEDMAHHRCQ